MSHTPEPWHLPKGSTCMESNSGEVPRSEANARRIVACVNACAGISTELLECPGGNVAKVAGRLMKQRDELLAALTEIAELDILKYHHAYAIAKGAIEEIEALKCSNS